MSDRVILAVKFISAGAGDQVRKAVGGFLRYVQHRDLHPTQPEAKPLAEISGLVKYVAYRDRASARAELFGPAGILSSQDRKAFAAYVANALDRSSPQLFGGRDRKLHDRRRAVYRMVISPEHARGLDLRRLTRAAVGRLERDSGASGLRWIAAIHRNTAHHHVHLVLAGMRGEGEEFLRVDLSKRRLAAMKEALSQEIERQRAERAAVRQPSRAPSVVTGADKYTLPAPQPLASRPALVWTLHKPPRAGMAAIAWGRASLDFRSHAGDAALRLRAVARHYQRQMEHELEAEARRRGWERAA